jgi:hypothetical protein
MRARTAKRLLIAIGAFMVGSLALMAITGDEEARELLGEQVVVWILIGGLFLAAWWFKVRPRRAYHRDQAARLGFTTAPGDPLRFLDRPFLFLRATAGMRDVENTSWGTWRGMDITVFDYWFARSSDPTRDDYEYFTCATAPVPVTWRRVAVLPARLRTRIADAASLPRITLEVGAFNRAFDVRTDDPRFANALLDQRMLEWLLGLPDGSGFEIVDGTVLVHVPRRVDRDVEGALSTLAALRDRIPAVVGSLFG